MPRTDKEYVEHSTHCPFCDFKDVEAQEEPDCEGNMITQLIKCLKCGKEWHDIYKLIGYHKQ